VGWAIGSRRRAGAARRTTAGPPFVYWPLAGPFLLSAVIAAVVLAGLLLVGVVTYALGRLGIGPQAAALVLVGSLLGGAVNPGKAPARPWPRRAGWSGTVRSPAPSLRTVRLSR
jgi:hypothetical protein